MNVSVEAYEALSARKRPNESFTQVILRLARPGSLLDLAGILSNEQAQQMIDDLADSRRRSRERSDRQWREWPKP